METGALTTAAGTGAEATAGSAGTFAVACAASTLPLSACVGEAALPGTPPVTLIESPLRSSLGADTAADGAASAELSGGFARIESPIAPPLDDVVGASGAVMLELELTCAIAGRAIPSAKIETAIDHDANSANHTGVVALNSTRLAFFGFFTIVLRRELGIYLVVKLKKPRLRMTRHSNSGHLQSFAQHGH